MTRVEGTFLRHQLETLGFPTETDRLMTTKTTKTTKTAKTTKTTASKITKTGKTNAEIAKKETEIARKIRSADNNILNAGRALAIHCYHEGHGDSFRRLEARTGVAYGVLHEWARFGALVIRMEEMQLPPIKRSGAAKILVKGFKLPEDLKTDKLDVILREFANKIAKGPAMNESDAAKEVRGIKKATRIARPAGVNVKKEAGAAPEAAPVKKETPAETVRRAFTDSILALGKVTDS